MISKEVKQESSIPVQGRVSVIVLAELAKYWDTETEYSVRTMSQLVSWSLELLREILVANEKIVEGSESIVEARDYLVARRLWQKSLADKAFKKLGTAVRFQGFRDKGEDPETRDKDSRVGHHVLHNKHSVEPFPGKVSSRRQELVDRAVKKYNELYPEEAKPEKLSQEDANARYYKKQAELKELKGETIEEVKNSNVTPKVPYVKSGMSDEEYETKLEEIKERDKARMELEKSAEISKDDIVEG